MPRFDGTGPQGKGPMTGRGMGFCILKKPKDKPGEVNGFVGIQGTSANQYGYGQFYTAARPMYDRGFGRGFRGGRNRFGL
ncbi:MAG: DUF5320 domain-containing protein [Sedimentisphaerales bacterium]|nr:DUF5320 domain-containing protein [Sedimentisphaerales bacterium]